MLDIQETLAVSLSGLGTWAAVKCEEQGATKPEKRAVLDSILYPRDTWEGFSTGACPA